MKKLSFLLMILLIFTFRVSAEEKIYEITKTSEKPRIDGLINDEIWKNSQWQGNFTQFEPNSGELPSQKTTFSIVFDEEYIYVAIRCYDKHPDLINQQMSRRDGQIGDFVAIGFDSYYDKRTMFVFGVSAAGVKNDFVLSNDGENTDMSWDPIWDVKTKVDSLGWTAEMRIPFNQLRFNKDADVWGLNVVRLIFRLNEQSSWNFVDMKKNGFISQSGVLSGMGHVESKRYFEISPYFMTGFHRYEPEEGNPFATGKDFMYNVGLDGKLALTNDFMMSFTINPDFGQVEADPSDVNLSGFETYFSEKRPFFIENQEITNVVYSFRGENLFYSRRIGSSPHYYPELASNEYARVPNNSRILGALKISGKSKNGLSLSIIEALTNTEYAKIQNTEGNIRKESIEPMTNYFLARIQQDINKGNSMIGGFFTNTYRIIKSENLNSLTTSATVGGFDFTQYFKDRKYFIRTKTLFSNVFGSKESITNLQLAPQRYMQRPDADYLTVDTNATSMAGSYINFSFGKSAMKGFRYEMSLFFGSPKFEANDMGYLRQTNYMIDVFWIGYSLPNSFKNINSFNINFVQWSGFDYGLENPFLGYNLNSYAQFENLWSLSFYFEHNLFQNSTELLRGGPSVPFPSQVQLNLSMHTNPNKKFVFGTYLMFSDQKYDVFNRYGAGIELSFKPFNFMTLSAEGSYVFEHNSLQYVETLEDSENYYILSSIDQHTVNLTLRCDVNITPEITIQYYGSPFVSDVNYYDFKNMYDPKNPDYFSRFILSQTGNFDFDNDGINDYQVGNYDFNFQQFRSNLVFRWEFMHGSLFYLVWSHDQTNLIEESNFKLGKNFSDLFKIFPSDIIMAKIQFKFI